MTTRPTLDQYMMDLALVASHRTTCVRRGVGCVLADGMGHVLAVGYNGVAAGQSHCRDSDAWRCPGHTLPSGSDGCEAVHAEQNAVLQCRDPWTIRTAYVTLSPCRACLKLMLNTSCRRIVCFEEHTDLWAKGLWANTGGEWLIGRGSGLIVAACIPET